MVYSSSKPHIYSWPVMIKPQYINSEIYLMLFLLSEILKKPFYKTKNKKMLIWTIYLWSWGWLWSPPLHISLSSIVVNNLFLLFTSAIAIGFCQSLDDKLQLRMRTPESRFRPLSCSSVLEDSISQQSTNNYEKGLTVMLCIQYELDMNSDYCFKSK